MGKLATIMLAGLVFAGCGHQENDCRWAAEVLCQQELDDWRESQ